MPNKNQTTRPIILNVFKPAGMTSYDVIRAWKHKLKVFGKVGHFGTLDPFASGVLMLGAGGGQRLNDFIHECLPKTYLGIGKLGVETDTGDLTEGIAQVDDSPYVKETIANLPIEFIQKSLEEKFLGDYWQAPHKYSAAKFEGKPLHRWAREGVEIKKEEKLRQVYKLEVVKYSFPYLSIRFQVSSGTYIRTLFSDCANYLGTLGVLVSLVRENVGPCRFENALKKGKWKDDEFDVWEIDEVLEFQRLILADKEASLFANGVKLKVDRVCEIQPGKLQFDYAWVQNIHGRILGLADISDDEIKSKINFPV